MQRTYSHQGTPGDIRLQQSWDRSFRSSRLLPCRDEDILPTQEEIPSGIRNSKWGLNNLLLLLITSTGSSSRITWCGCKIAFHNPFHSNITTTFHLQFFCHILMDNITYKASLMQGHSERNAQSQMYQACLGSTYQLVSY